MNPGDRGPLPIAVIIPTLDGRQLLELCLPPLLEQVAARQVVVVDNASSDETLSWIASCHPEVSTVANASNRLFAGGVNDGIRAARETIDPDYFLVLNNDAVVGAGALETLFHFMDENPGAGACQPVLVAEADHTSVDSAGVALTLGGRAADYQRGEQLASLPNAPFPVLGVTGGAMFVRAAALEEIGLFDEQYGMYFEDVDLSLRLRRAGWTCFCVPSARASHLGSATTDRLDPTLRYAYCERNSFRILLSHYPPVRALQAAALRLVTGPAASLHHFLRGNHRLAWRILTAAAFGAGLTANSLVRPSFWRGRRGNMEFLDEVDWHRLYP